ncbi:MAG: response regulator transcription factor [Saprospiraceae bacterium]
MKANTAIPIKVSIVEDSIDLCRTLEMMINATNGMSCLSTHFDGESALVRIPSNPPDILLIDLGLPKISGIEVIQKLKRDLPGLAFLVLTIRENDEDVFNALKAGASGYLLKTDSPSKIIESIRELYDGGAPMTTNIARKVVSFFFGNTPKESPYDHLLTTREKEILELLSGGKFYKEIAFELHISIETVKSHCHNIYEKLHVSTRTEALNKYYVR